MTLASNGSATNIVASISATHTRLEKTNGRLATGLRINAPADDPSGFVIAAKLQTQSQAYDNIAQSVQNTHNAVEVASNAIDAIISITQRIRALSVKAATNLDSPQQIADLQNEVRQLIAEVNSISENTKFNGVALLRGQPSPRIAIPQITQSTSASLNSGPVGATVSISATLPAAPKAGDLLVAGLAHGDGFFANGGYATIVPPPDWHLVDNSDNGFDNGMAIYTHVVAENEVGTYTWAVSNSQPGNTLRVAIGEIHNANIASPLATEVTQLVASAAVGDSFYTAQISANSDGLLPLAFFNSNCDGGQISTTPGWSTVEYPYQFFNSLQMQQHALTTAGEVLQAGVDPNPGFPVYGYASILLVNPKIIIDPLTLTTQIGAEVGQIGEGSIAVISANSLTLSNVDVRQSAQTAIASCDGALSVLTEQQGSLGAYALALRDFADEANIMSVADTAAYSAIRDADVAQEVSNNVRDTILQVYGTSLLARANISAASVLQLFRSPATA